MALPKGYAVPQGTPKENKYAKIADGKNKFRILSDIITGYIWWEDEDGKRVPHRVADFKEIPSEVLSRTEDRAKHFWAMAVYEYASKDVKILEIAQATVQKALESYEKSEDWGELKDYDITITRAGKERDTVYSVLPSPKKAMDEGVLAFYKDLNIDLTQLYVGGNPFDSTKEEKVDMDELVAGFDAATADLDK